MAIFAFSKGEEIKEVKFSPVTPTRGEELSLDEFSFEDKSLVSFLRSGKVLRFYLSAGCLEVVYSKEEEAKNVMSGIISRIAHDRFYSEVMYQSDVMQYEADQKKEE